MLTERRFVLIQLMVLVPVVVAVPVLMSSQAIVRRVAEVGWQEWGPLIHSADRLEQLIDEIDESTHVSGSTGGSRRNGSSMLDHMVRFQLDTTQAELFRLRRPKLNGLFNPLREAVLRTIALRVALSNANDGQRSSQAFALNEAFDRQVQLVHQQRIALEKEAFEEVEADVDHAARAALFRGRILLDVTIALEIAALGLSTIWFRRSRGRIKQVNLRLAQLADEHPALESSDDIEVVERTIDRLQEVLEQKQLLSETLSRVALEWTESFDAVASPMLVVDSGDRIARLNRAAARLARMSYDEAIGRNLADISGDEPWSTASEFGRDLPSGTSAQKVTRSDGRLWEIYVHVGSNRRILFFLDRTKIDRLQDDLRRSEMMATLGTLVGGVAHEVRNPLFGLSAAIDALESEEDATAVLPEYLKSLRNDLHRLQRLMNDLLEFGKPRSVGTTPVEIPRLVHHTTSELRTASMELGLEILILERGPTPATVLGTESDLFIALRNVIDNAIRHSPSRGTITISIENLQDRVVVTIVDGGRGFEPGDLDRVFQPFYSRRKGGTGLGLALVKKIVEVHGGKVSAGNTESGGGSVSIHLPTSTSHPRDEDLFEPATDDENPRADPRTRDAEPHDMA